MKPKTYKNKSLFKILIKLETIITLKKMYFLKFDLI